MSLPGHQSEYRDAHENEVKMHGEGCDVHAGLLSAVTAGIAVVETPQEGLQGAPARRDGTLHLSSLPGGVGNPAQPGQSRNNVCIHQGTKHSRSIGTAADDDQHQDEDKLLQGLEFRHALSMQLLHSWAACCAYYKLL